MTKNRTPFIYAVAGAPASGKSTFVNLGLKENLFPAEAFVHDCDAVMCALEGYKSDLKQLGPAAAYGKWELPAREKAEAELFCAVEEKRDIVYDRSCALLSSYTFLKDLVQNRGYKLVMHALYTTIDQALIRAKYRENQTGRHAPAAIIQERLEMLSALWPHYLTFADKAYLYNNTEIIASYDGNKLEIGNPALYEHFLSLGSSRNATVKSFIHNPSHSHV